MKTIIALAIVAVMGTVGSAFAGGRSGDGFLIGADSKAQIPEQKSEQKVDEKQERATASEAKAETTEAKKPFHFEGHLANKY